MPRGDRTGPLGQGPMTGRRMGVCTGYNRPGMMNHFFGGGFGRGRGMGYRRYFPYSTEPYPVEYSAEEEAGILHTQAEELKSGLKDIENRLAQLEKKSVKEKEK